MHLFQIWLLPNVKRIAPEYEQGCASEFAVNDRTGLRLAASRDGRGGSFKIHQDSDLYIRRFTSGHFAEFPLRYGQDGRGAWLQMIRGEIDLHGMKLHAGDGAAAEQEPSLGFSAMRESEFLMFDLPRWKSSRAVVNRLKMRL